VLAFQEVPFVEYAPAVVGEAELVPNATATKYPFPYVTLLQASLLGIVDAENVAGAETPVATLTL
jgi:hypothetical protein